MVDNIHSSTYTKLSSGKFGCLICAHCLVFDTPLMLSVRRGDVEVARRSIGERVSRQDMMQLQVHVKGSSHRAAESRLRERELGRQDEIKKRIALSECDTATSKTLCRSASKPLIERTRKVVSDVLHQNLTQSIVSQVDEIKSNKDDTASSIANRRNSQCVPRGVATTQTIIPQTFDRKRREREIKFTSVGWKHDGHGRWFKDENVEFDSDEEDPNLCLP